MPVSTTFTAVGSGRVLPVDHNQKFGYLVSGAFVGTVALEVSETGGQSWEVVTSLTAPRGEVLLSEFRQNGTKWYRFTCTAYTSGSIITSLTNVESGARVSTETLKLKAALTGVTSVTAANKKRMSSPPTIIKQADYAHPSTWATPLASAVTHAVNTIAMPNAGGVVAINPRIELATGALTTIGVGNLGYNDASAFDFMAANSSVGGTSRPSIQTARFVTDAPYFGLGFCLTVKMAIRVDGEWATNAFKTYTTVGYERYYVTLDFAGIRKSRLIEVFFWNTAGFGVVAIGPFDSLWAPPKTALNIVADGDSYLQGETYYLYNGVFSEFAAAVNAGYLSYPIGGTGYLTVSGGYPNALTRLPQVTTAFGGQPDVVMIALGINDPKDSTSKANIASYFKALRAALPKALFVVLGPWCPTETSGTSFNSTVGAAIKASVRAAGGEFILIDNIAGTYEASWGASGSLGGTPWQTGTRMTLVGSAGVAITSISRTTNVVTVDTATAHGLTSTNTAVVMDSGSFNGQFTATVVTATQFTYPQTAANETGTTLGTAGKLLVAGTGNGNVSSIGDGTHGNKEEYQYLSQRILEAVKTAVGAYA